LVFLELKDIREYLVKDYDSSIAGDGTKVDEIVAFHMPVSHKDKNLTGIICLPVEYAVSSIISHEAAHAVFCYLDKYPSSVVEEEDFCYPLGRVCGRITEALSELPRKNDKAAPRDSLKRSSGK